MVSQLLRVAHMYLSTAMWLVSDLQPADPLTAKERDDALAHALASTSAAQITA